MNDKTDINENFAVEKSEIETPTENISESIDNKNSEDSSDVQIGRIKRRSKKAAQLSGSDELNGVSQNQESRLENLSVEEFQREDLEGKIGLRFKLDNFTGPLDLLIALIQKNEMDLFSISLSKITTDYLAYINIAQRLDLELAGEFILLAATLIRMKAKALLPNPEPEEEISEEASAEELMRRLKEYEKYLEVVDFLKEKEQVRSEFIPRNVQLEEVEEIEFVEVNIFDLYSAFKKVMAEIEHREPPAIMPEEFTIDEKMFELETFAESQRVFDLIPYLLTARSKLEVIVIFLALLELIRLHVIGIAKSSHDQRITIRYIGPRPEIDEMEQEETINEINEGAEPDL